MFRRLLPLRSPGVSAERRSVECPSGGRSEERRPLALRRLPVVVIAALAVAVGVGVIGPTAYALDNSTGLVNGRFELPRDASAAAPQAWTSGAFQPTTTFSWSSSVARSGHRSVSISSPQPNDAWWSQTVAVQPHTLYRITGWIKTVGVAHSTNPVDAGASLGFLGTWDRSPGVFGTSDWTKVWVSVNSGDSHELTVAARLGYWSGTTTGTAWYDDIKLERLEPGSSAPRWKILALIYPNLDFSFPASDGTTHHVVAQLTQDQRDRAARATHDFIKTDLPALASGTMTPSLTVRFPTRPLSALDRSGDGWWPSPGNTAADQDPSFDSVIVIWPATGTNTATGQPEWIGSAAGLTPPMGTGQTYSTLILDAAINYGHRNVFKHEFGHSILDYFEALGVAPTPTVNNHATAGQYVHCGTATPYVWADETLANPIPNSIFNNTSGFTHDYYSGTTAEAADPNHCLGITRTAWRYGGPHELRGIQP